jgi:hypothetical protein
MILILMLAIGVFPASAAPDSGSFTSRQLEARGYADLGAEKIDVSGYPKTQQENYAAFAAVCSRCHTLARPINSPLAARADWRRYVKRMHVRSKIESDKTFDKEQAKKVIDFLAYDSQVRKIERKAAFDAETERLKKFFVEVRAQRTRLQIESDARKAKPYGDQSSATPRP